MARLRGIDPNDPIHQSSYAQDMDDKLKENQFKVDLNQEIKMKLVMSGQTGLLKRGCETFNVLHVTLTSRQSQRNLLQFNRSFSDFQGVKRGFFQNDAETCTKSPRSV